MVVNTIITGGEVVVNTISFVFMYRIGLNHIGDRGAELIVKALEENKSESVKEI